MSITAGHVIITSFGQLGQARAAKKEALWDVYNGVGQPSYGSDLIINMLIT